MNRGDLLKVKIDKVYAFGVFVRLEDDSVGYIRRRELSWDRYIEPLEVFREEQELDAELIDAEIHNSLELSLRLTLPNPWIQFGKQYRVGDRVEGIVRNVHDNEIYVEIIPGIEGIVTLGELSLLPIKKARDMFWTGDRIVAEITSLDVNGTRLELSIRQLLAKEARIADLVQALFQKTFTEKKTSTIFDGHTQNKPFDLSQLGRVLLVEDTVKLLTSFADWLHERGCDVDTASTYSQAEDLAQIHQYGLAIVDLELDAGNSGLSFIETQKVNLRDAQIIVMSIPSNIQQRFEKITELNVVTVLSKPFELDEVEATLSKIATGIPIDVAHSPQRADQTTEQNMQMTLAPQDSASFTLRLKQLVEHVVVQTNAEACMLFRKDSKAQRIEILEDIGCKLNTNSMDMLHESPLIDVLDRNQLIIEKNVRNRSAKFQNLLALMNFESCVGLPVTSGHDDNHALFLFYKNPERFAESDIVQATAIATHLSAILDRISLNEQMRFLDKMVVSGQLASGFAHEIFNQLSALNIQMQNMVRFFGKIYVPDNEQHVDAAKVDWPKMASMMADLSEITGDLMGTATSFRLSQQPKTSDTMRLSGVFEHIRATLQATAQRNNVFISLEPIEAADDIPIDADIAQHIFLNILLNGIQHIGEMDRKRGSIEIKVTRSSGEEKPIKIRITDNGPGIHGRLWERVFQPGFSTRDDGTGWGLHIVRTLARSIGGSVCVENSIMQMGTSFLVELEPV